MRNVDDKQIAERLVAIITPGDDSITGMIRAGEDIAAVVTLVEMAAKCVSPFLRRFVPPFRPWWMRMRSTPRSGAPSLKTSPRWRI